MADQTAKSGLIANWAFTIIAALSLAGGLVAFAMTEGKDNGMRDTGIANNTKDIQLVNTKTDQLLQITGNHENRIQNLETENVKHWEEVMKSLDDIRKGLRTPHP